jgi:hypothetical protein
MAKTTVKLLIEAAKNSITFSKNFRIYSTTDPVKGISAFTDFLEDLILPGSPGSIDLSYLKRYFRYSRNLLDWSLWYEVEPGNLGDAESIFLDKAECYYFEVKYEYDNGNLEELESPIQINEIKLRFKKEEDIPAVYTPVVICSDEKCTSIIANRNPTFRPYAVDSAIGMYQDLSFFTNQLYGHEVVYFRTLPDTNSGDYIFKEWTLYKNVDRKCIKVAVPKNAFPSNMPKFGEFGFDFQLPFEIHIDHRYFQSIFGSSSEPRKRDFLYFPLINRMFEIQGSYLHRGFMMAPTFWKIQLKKYNPNIDMLLKDESRTFLDNVILSAETLFKDEVEKDTKDATMPQQYAPITKTFDPSRKAIHPDISIKPLKYTYNFASLIENYYDLAMVPSSQLVYKLTNDTPPLGTSINLKTLPSLDDKIIQQNDVVLAYQGSEAFTSWKNNSLLTNDINFVNQSSLFCRVRGPFDYIENNVGQSIPGRYIRIEAYRDLQYKSQRNILKETISGEEYVKFKVKEAAVIYNATPTFNLTTNQNLSYTALFNVPSANNSLYFINGFDNLTQTGIKIDAQFIKYFASQPEGDLTITLQINGQIKTNTVANFKSGAWHAIVISASNEFKQYGVYVYSIKEDPSDIINHNDFILEYSSAGSITAAEFSHQNNYYLPSSNMSIANIRLFNTMIKEEQHDFILSQQFIKDESMLILIDNCRPQLNIPYIAKNR